MGANQTNARKGTPAKGAPRKGSSAARPHSASVQAEQKKRRALRAAASHAAREVPRFSFIIPTYISPRAVGGIMALGRCVESVLAQTVRSWEMIIVHDGPSEIARAFVQGLREDPRLANERERITYIEAPYVGERGGHQSCNVGIERARGEFVVLLNMDNTIREHYIASMYDADADILIGSVLMNDIPGHILNGRGWHRGGIDRLNYAIRTGIAREVRHLMHMDADYDYLIDCWNHRDAVAPVRVRYCEAVVAEHN